MSGLTTEALKLGLQGISNVIECKTDELNAADAKLGDGDIGITLSRGICAVCDSCDSLPKDVGMALFQCAKAFTSKSGSSFGTLLATGLMRAAKDCKGREDIPWEEISALLRVALLAMMARGKGSFGEKSVLDPIAAIADAIDYMNDPMEMLAAADQALDETLDLFRNRPAKLGRARMFADKSVGLDDPGMLALKCMVDGLIV